MKTIEIGCFFCLLLTACGQPGPLYLPTDKPPIYVAPEPEPEPEAKENVEKKEAASPPQSIPKPKPEVAPEESLKKPATEPK